MTAQIEIQLTSMPTLAELQSIFPAVDFHPDTCRSLWGIEYLVAIAYRGHRPQALAAAQYGRSRRRAKLNHLYPADGAVADETLAGLLRHLEQRLLEKRYNQLNFDYNTADQPAVSLANCLQRLGWDSPTTVHVTMTWQIDVQNDKALLRYEKHTPAGQIGREFPEDCTVFDWATQLTESDQRWLDRYIEAFPVELANLYPAYDDQSLFPTSLGLRVGDQLAGWLVQRQAGPSRLRFHMLYLHPTFRGRRLGLKLINEAVRRTVAACRAQSTAGNSLWSWQAQSTAQNSLMLAFYELTADLLTSRHEQRSMTYFLQSEPKAAAA